MKKPSLPSTLILGCVLLLAGCNMDPAPNQKILDQMHSQRNKQKAAQKGPNGVPSAGMNPYGNPVSTPAAPTNP